MRILAVRRAPGDLDHANDIVSRLEAELAPGSEPALQLWLLQCRAVLADAMGDEPGRLKAVTDIAIWPSAWTLAATSPMFGSWPDAKPLSVG